MSNKKPRGAPVTLEEMTRRRDGWRARHDSVLAQLGNARRRSNDLLKQVMKLEYEKGQLNAEAGRLANELGAARAEARRFAEECGRLRDELARRSAPTDLDLDGLTERLRRVVQDASDNGVQVYGTINFALPEYVLTWYDGERTHHRSLRHQRRDGSLPWEVSGE